MLGILKRDNDALTVNPDVYNYPTSADIAITTHGSDWYWAGMAVMALSTIIIMGMGFTVPRCNRVFYYITASITLIATISYFTMASNLGWVPIFVEFQRSNLPGLTRQIFYARHVDWALTTPLLLLDILLTAALPWPTIVYTILLDEVMVVSGLIGVLVSSSYKWGYFTISMVALICVSWNVLFVARKHAFALGPNVHRTFLTSGVWLMFLWFLYPIAWGLSEGGNVIHPDSEAAFYGVLDVLSKPVFGILLLWGHRNIDPAALGLRMRDFGDDVVVREKRGTQNNGVVADTPAGTTNV